jgi:hypothetical protein
LAFALTHEMPLLLALMESGLVSERRALLVVQECAVLSLEDRAQVDAELAHTVGEELGRLSERELVGRVRAIVYRLDAESVVKRAAHAESERRVTLRPAPDTMCWLTALLPAVQGVATLAALTKAADAARAGGDPRSKGQVMADTLVERVTGLTQAGQVPVEVQLVVTDKALLSGDDTAADLIGYGTVPAEWARRRLRPQTTLTTTSAAAAGSAATSNASSAFDPDASSAATGPSATSGASTAPVASSGSSGAFGPSAASAASAESDGGSGASTPSAASDSESGAAAAGPEAVAEEAQVWLRRLYTHPGEGTLVAMDSRRRVFDGALRRFLLARDGGICRTPGCGAPIRHVDHVDRHTDGGSTNAGNGQGLCVRCNLVKELIGWQTRVVHPREPAAGRGHRHTVEIITPTGHRYSSHAPPLVHEDPGLSPSALERALERALAA